MNNSYFKSFLSAACCVIFFLGCNQPNIGDDLTRETKYGKVRGQTDETNTWVWKAIPYAKPPVGDLRWKSPIEPDSWSGILEKTDFCNDCVQYLMNDQDFSIKGIVGDEDCLYLNIWRPRTDEENLPVYFWIHGGGNSIQSPKNRELTGNVLAGKKNMVVVTINYRLGPMGWFTHPALRDGSNHDNSGNYGTLDIIMALKWVRENISSFGGNPANVTIAGESAGGFNIFSLLISDIASGLFHKVVIQSGLPSTATINDGDLSAEGVIIKLLMKDGLAADETSARTVLNGMTNSEIKGYLSSKPAQEIQECYAPGYGGMITFPNIFADGAVIPTEGYSRFDDGTYPGNVPMIMGTTKDELKLFVILTPQFISVYRGTATQDEIELFSLVSKYGSNLLKSQIDSLARKLRCFQQSIYIYQFQWGSGEADSVLPYPYNYALGACHSSDIPFFFGLVDNPITGIAKRTFTDQNRYGRIALSNAIIDYVGNFAEIGNPNGTGSDLPSWDAWSNGYLLAPKSILLNADYDNIKIDMSTMEYSQTAIMLELLLEPRYSEIVEALTPIMESL